MKKKSKSNRFCHDILTSGIKRARALCNLIMAMSSYVYARSIVQLSLSPVYHYQFSSIFNAIHDIAPDAGQYRATQQKVQALCMGYYDKPDRQVYVFQTDTTPACKPHSPTLEGRTNIHISNNVIPGNKPLSVGYELSYINISDIDTSWSLPLSIERIGVNQTATQKVLEQLKGLLEHPKLELDEKLLINTLDSKFGNAAYLSPIFDYDNIVSIVRFRSGIKVWVQDYDQDTGGAPRVYGQKFYLNEHSQMKIYRHPKTKRSYAVEQNAIFDLPHTHYQQLPTKTKKGRPLLIELWRWDQMMIRSKKGHNMKDKPFDLVAVRITDAKTGKRVFNQDMFLCIHGQRKDEVTTAESHQYYRRRYDIEPYFRFAKQRLQLENYQALEAEHFDNWLLAQQLSTWLLYTASTETNAIPHKWEQYLDTYKQPAQNTQRLSISKTFRAAQNLFLTFDQEPFKPLKSKKGKGRQKGQTQPQRTHYAVVKKQTNSKNIKLTTEKIE